MQITPRYDGPVIIAITGENTDHYVPFARQRRRFEAMLTTLDDSQWRTPSRCASWSVHDVVAHLVGVNQFWTASITAGLAGRPTRYLVGFDPVATPDLMISSFRETPSIEVLRQFVDSNEALLAALNGIDLSGWEKLAEAPPGHVAVRDVVSHALWDAWIHERDVALPLGLSTPVEDDEVTTSLRYVCALSAAFAITEGLDATGSYLLEAHNPALSMRVDVGESVLVSDVGVSTSADVLRGPAVSLLESMSFRSPLSADTPTSWRRLLRGLAHSFNSDVELSD